MLWEYMDLTVLLFFETWSAHIFGGWQRVCWCTNEAFNQASPTKEFWENCPQKRVGIFTVKMRGGHIYGNYCTVWQPCLVSYVWYSLQIVISPTAKRLNLVAHCQTSSTYHMLRSHILPEWVGPVNNKNNNDVSSLVPERAAFFLLNIHTYNMKISCFILPILGIHCFLYLHFCS